MSNLIRISIFLMGFFLLPLSGFSFDDGDFQIWNTEVVSWKITPKLKASLEEELRFGNNANRFYYHHTDLGFLYSGVASWLDLGLNYRYVREERSGKWKYESRPHPNIIVKGKFLDIAISNRFRFEYRNRQEAEDFWRYRNKITAKLPHKFTKFEIQPYIADEFFYDFDVETLNANRVYGGVSFKICKSFTGELYHIWQTSERSASWIDTQVLGAKFKLSF